MIAFKQKFIEDASDLLNNLEQSVLDLEQNKNNSALIEEIFSGMHTLKGTAGMYGFEEIGKITHRLENIYDLIRNGRLIVDKNILDFTLEIIDFLRKFLNQENNSELLSKFPIFYSKIEEILNSVGEDFFDGNKQEIDKISEQTIGFQTWFITIIPDDDLRNRGVKIHTIFNEFDALGHNQIFNRLKKKDSNSVIFWELFLASQAQKSEIEDVLLFIDDVSEIHHLAEGNLFESENFILRLNEIEKESATDLEQLKEFITQILQKDEKSSSSEIVLESVKIESIKVSSDRLDEQMTLLSELVTIKAEIQLLVEKYSYKHLLKSVENIDKITRLFRKNIFKIRLIPIETLHLRFDRLIRDLSAQLGKEVDFITEGMNTELDKTIIDNIETPLMHLIRNSIDHGIETPEIRQLRGKSGRGVIKLSAKQVAAYVYITVSDDGEGIDILKIKNKAIAKGLLKVNEQISDEQLLELIFKSGFSTAQNLTEVSGRGVGMDVVKQTINQLRGSVELKSEKGIGSSFIIKIPLTLSIIDTMLVRSNQMFYSIPLAVIDKCTEIKIEDIRKFNNKYIKLDGELISYIVLKEYLKVENNMGNHEYVNSTTKSKVVIVRNENKRTALIVDEVIGEHQAVLKTLGEYFNNQEYFSGASQLADGNIALVLDTNKLCSNKN